LMLEAQLWVQHFVMTVSVFVQLPSLRFDCFCFVLPTDNQFEGRISFVIQEKSLLLSFGQVRSLQIWQLSCIRYFEEIGGFSCTLSLSIFWGMELGERNLSLSSFCCCLGSGDGKMMCTWPFETAMRPEQSTQCQLWPTTT
jgi:hypothetical protein